MIKCCFTNYVIAAPRGFASKNNSQSKTFPLVHKMALTPIIFVKLTTNMYQCYCYCQFEKKTPQFDNTGHNNFAPISSVKKLGSLIFRLFTLLYFILPWMDRIIKRVLYVHVYKYYLKVHGCTLYCCLLQSCTRYSRSPKFFGWAISILG